MERSFMQIAGLYSFANGQDYIQKKYPKHLKEVAQAIKAIDANTCKTKTSEEKTMIGQMLFSPVKLNEKFLEELMHLGWVHSVRVYCDYPTKYYVEGYSAPKDTKRPFRDMDFVKDKLGCEVQFGKYSFMVYNVCAKMTIFRNLGHIVAGIEIVPVKSLAEHMSTGVSYFEQFVWDLEKRGAADIDVPTLIIGIDA